MGHMKAAIGLRICIASPAYEGCKLCCSQVALQQGVLLRPGYSDSQQYMPTTVVYSAF